MELQQLSCCGIFELADVGDDYMWREEDETYNSETNEYEYKKRTREEAIRACKADIALELSGITPKGRMVMATTVARMGIAKEALESLKFKPSRPFRNGNSGSRVTIWTKYVR